ncbi:MAG: glycosyltransferase family 4 protein [Gemmatimonadales bacterium]
MRCLLIVPSLARAGAETQLVALANGIADRGHDVHLLTFERNIDQVTSLSRSVRHHAAGRMWKYDLSYTRDIAHVIHCEGIQVLHTTMEFGLLAGWVGRLRSQARLPLVASLHTTLSRSHKYNYQVRFLYRYLLRHCARIVFVCKNQREYWGRRFPELDRLSVVIHNGVSLDRFQPHEWVDEGGNLRERVGIPTAAVVFGCVAGFRPEKAHHTLLEAFSRAPETAHMLLAGDGPLRSEIEDRVAGLGLSDRTHFLGEVTDCRPVIAACDAMVLTSISETFPMAMLESMAMGVPMISPAIGGLPEAIQDGQTGWLVPMGNPVALAQQMQCIVKDPSQVVSIGARARQVVHDRYTETRMVDQTVDLLENVVAGHT